jgi:hypothetical protein
VLVITMLLTLVLAAIVLALASYAMVGVKTSKVTTERTESNAVSSSAVNWVIEEFAAKRLRPDLDCAVPDSVIAVPAGVSPSGTTSVTCTPQPEIGFHPTVLLDAVGTTATGMDRPINVLVQVPRDQYTIQVRSWTIG